MVTAVNFCRPKRPRGIYLPCAVLIAFVTAVAAAHADSGPPLLDSLPQIWRDEDGVVFNLHGLSGHPVVLTMAYASCHRICPLTMQRLQQLQERFDAQQIRAEFVVVGYDPESDDAAAWRRYRRTRHLTRANWHFLIGSTQQVSRFARVLGFEFWKADEHVMHDGRILYLDPQGVLQLDPGSGVQQASITE